MKKFFEQITNTILDNIDMSQFSSIDDVEYQKYYQDVSSKEHYRLLCHISKSFNEQIILDVGTLKGCSALALSINQKNKVYSFNLNDELKLIKKPENVDFIIDNILNGKYDSILSKSNFILLDTFHDGVFEEQFLEYLIKLSYTGVLILDDIYLNNDMISFWEKINLNKLDLTHLGHATGTGVVFFV